MMKYSELKRKAIKNPDDSKIIELLRLRELFICAASMKYNSDYPNVIGMLTNVNITIKHVETLCDNLLRDYKKQEKELHSNKQIYSEELSELFGDVK